MFLFLMSKLPNLWRTWCLWFPVILSYFDLSDQRKVCHLVSTLKRALLQIFRNGFFFVWQRTNLHLWMAWWIMFFHSYFWKCSWTHAVFSISKSDLFLILYHIRAQRWRASGSYSPDSQNLLMILCSLVTVVFELDGLWINIYPGNMLKCPWQDSEPHIAK